MITIKLPYKTEDSAYIDFLRNQYSNIVRYSFNRFKENITQKEIRSRIKSLNNINDINSWLQQCAIKEGESVFNRNTDNKVIFGSKKQFYRRLKGLISNNELKESRLLPINIQGEKFKMGNRSFKLDIVNNNQIIFKVNRNKHIQLRLPNIKNNYKRKLHFLEKINNIKQGEEGHTFSIKIDSEFVYITFEPIKGDGVLNNIQSRYIGIDLNPNEIGISIKDGNKILEVRRYILNLKSNDKNKILHEIFEISKKISSLFKKYNCKFIFIENLNIKTKNHNKGRNFNKTVNNRWIRNKFINNLKQKISNFGGYLFKINPAYTSFIGNLMYDFDDSINASLEIGRRGYEVIILKNKKFYPELNMKSLKDRWKEYLSDNIKSWKELFFEIKNSKVKYRVSSNLEVFSHLSKSSKIDYYFYLF